LSTPPAKALLRNFVCACLAVWFLLFASSARADLSLEFTTEGVRQIPIAVLPFGQEVQLTALFTPVILADLQRSGLFRAVDPGGVTPVPTEPGQLRLADWRARKAEHVLVGSVARLADGRLEVRFHLVDAVTEAQRLALAWTIAPGQVRGTAHRIADAVYENLIGERGVFSTKIAYIVKGGGRYQLKVADADAFNEQTVLASREPIISPRWSPDGTRMAYVTFELKRPAVVVQNLATGARKVVAKFKGDNSAPAWSPDGKRLALTLSRDGIAQIYTMDAEGTEAPRRVMSTRAIDTEACFTPDGQFLLFTSDRGGSPQIYRVPVEGGTAQRLTFTGNYNVSPRLSPDGRKMVFVQQSGAAFRVMLQELDTGQLQTLTDTTLDESPSFSPNGRMILYATRIGGRGALALVSADGRVRQRFTTQAGDVYEPAWGPLP
jgi:TolB protein